MDLMDTCETAMNLLSKPGGTKVKGLCEQLCGKNSKVNKKRSRSRRSKKIGLLTGYKSRRSQLKRRRRGSKKTLVPGSKSRSKRSSKRRMTLDKENVSHSRKRTSKGRSRSKKGNRNPCVNPVHVKAYTRKCPSTSSKRKISIGAGEKRRPRRRLVRTKSRSGKKSVPRSQKRRRSAHKSKPKSKRSRRSTSVRSKSVAQKKRKTGKIVPGCEPCKPCKPPPPPGC